MAVKKIKRKKPGPAASPNGVRSLGRIAYEQSRQRTQLTLYLSSRLVGELDEIAVLLDTSRSDVIRGALSNFAASKKSEVAALDIMS